MFEQSTNRDELTLRVESALDAADAALEAIDRVEGMKAFENAMLLDVLQIKGRIMDARIFAAGEHVLLEKLANRLGTVIEDATQVHYICDDSWDINPPHEERVVEPLGIAALELRTRLRELADGLGAVQNLVKAERLVIGVRTAKS
jgi:hypothetical protein